ncbi:MAG: winged helix-turn-helix domain-containing protein [Micromonosporaceae bacterium]
MDVRVLLVAHDTALREFVALVLQQAGLWVTTAASGRVGLRHARKGDQELVIVDAALPETDGFEVRRTLRLTSRVPVLMLTDGGHPVDAAAGLESGADDYLRKPFEPVELLTRVRHLLHRVDIPAQRTLSVGGIEVDAGSHTVRKHGAPVALTATEFRLLYEMARRPGQVLTRRMLLELVWHCDYLGDSRLVDVAVQRLRAKVEDDPRTPRLICTVRGVGYLLQAATGPAPP